MGIYTELTDAILEVDVIIAGGKSMHILGRCSLLASANMEASNDQVVPQAVSSLRGWQMRIRVCLSSSWKADQIILAYLQSLIQHFTGPTLLLVLQVLFITKVARKSSSLIERLS